ncbi:MAG: NAD(+) synthase, partial [Oscillospiraceae bacterium]
NGRVLGVVPKSYPPNFAEFYELRHFSKAPSENGIIEICGARVPFGTKVLFRCVNLPEFVLGIEICEDLFVTEPPSGRHSLAGATLIANPSASDELVCKARFRRDVVKIQSSRNVGAYIYCNAPQSESTTDSVFSAHNIIAENGVMLAESLPFKEGLCETEIDLSRLAFERRRSTSVRDNAEGDYIFVDFTLGVKKLELTRKFRRFPFIPSDSAECDERCEDILNIQSIGLARRIEHIGCRTAVLGVSGGLDSTLALLVTSRAFASLGRSARGIISVTMPCFGTTERTKSNAQKMCERLGVEFSSVDITASVKQHLTDIGHDGTTPDVTLENAQARERTQVLMDIANLRGGIVVGTGDLSELALGWCTYNGDQMSMYGVNASVPKTLVRHLVLHCAESCSDDRLRAVLLDVLDTPVSPELLPSDGNKVTQKTEAVVGPYELHDFFLYYAIRYGFPPRKILRLAALAFAGDYDEKTIKKWLAVFYRRFFNSQFKRSCSPDGPKVGSVALSPRGDWKMPSDASAALWLKELE